MLYRTTPKTAISLNLCSIVIILCIFPLDTSSQTVYVSRKWHCRFNKRSGFMEGTPRDDRCLNNTQQKQPLKSDWAYRWGDTSQISLITREHFSGSFPRDFSILVVAKPAPGYTHPLFTLYSQDGDEQLAVAAGNNVTLYYEDIEDEEGNSISFGVPIDDGEWYKLAFSVKGNSVTLIHDCNQIVTRSLARTTSSRLTV